MVHPPQQKFGFADEFEKSPFYPIITTFNDGIRLCNIHSDICFRRSTSDPYFFLFEGGGEVSNSFSINHTQPNFFPPCTRGKLLNFPSFDPFLSSSTSSSSFFFFLLKLAESKKKSKVLESNATVRKGR